MIIEKLAVGPLMANCFILGCEKTKEAVVIDPGDETDKILRSLAELGLTVKYIINTHGHFDHVGGNKEMKEATGADILINSLDAPMLSQLSTTAASFGLSTDNSPPPDQTLEDGDTISFGIITLKVIHTPGHSQGGVALFTDGNLFVGDTLFAGSIGRSDLPGGDMHTLISSIKNKLFVLNDDVKVFPGHGPDTTIGQEKRTNPFVRE
ncbi:MAG: MBL fold metallo-hydrolase [Deltaproteobacteria bacterium]|nr:MBL fold metallo-hydrolase [Deltaproteobacteria bacterium]MBW2661061.1 MBL fold metallo-hydrolase [Deltaproteobacteria bacterium]